MKTYNVTIRGRHGEIVDTRTVECTDNQDPAETAIEELADEFAELGEVHVSSVEVAAS